DPLSCRDPGDDLLDEVRRCLRHAPAGTRGTKPPPLATEGHQQLVVARITAEPEQPVRQDTAPQVVVKFPFHIGGEAGRLGVVMQRGEKGLQVRRDHVVEHRAAGLPRCVGGHRWCHTSPHGQQGESGSARRRLQLYCSFVQYTSKKVDEGMRRKHAGYTPLPPSLCVIRTVAGAKVRLFFLYAPEAHLWPSEVVTLGLLHALKGVGN